MRGEGGGRDSHSQFACVVRKGICCAFLRADERTAAVGRTCFKKSLRGMLMTYKGISRVGGPDKIISQSINQSINPSVNQSINRQRNRTEESRQALACIHSHRCYPREQRLCCNILKFVFAHGTLRLKGRQRWAPPNVGHLSSCAQHRPRINRSHHLLKSPGSPPPPEVVAMPQIDRSVGSTSIPLRFHVGDTLLPVHRIMSSQGPHCKHRNRLFALRTERQLSVRGSPSLYSKY